LKSAERHCPAVSLAPFPGYMGIDTYLTVTRGKREGPS
jgi:hypothetical protein